jgi:hypothetical protein
VVDPLLRRKASEKQHITIWTRGDRITFRLIKVGYNMNPILWDTHSYVFRALSLTKGNPRGHILKSPYRTDTAENESHETTDETTVSPAGGLEGRPEVATQTAFARLAVVQEKTVGAAHPIVMEVVNDRNFEIKGGLINGGGKSR